MATHRFLQAVFAAACTFSMAMVSQPAEKARAMAILETRPCVYFSFERVTGETLKGLGEGLSLSHEAGGRLYAYANRQEFEAFLQRGLAYRLEVMPGDRYQPSHIYRGPLDQFHGEALLDYDQHVALMNRYAQEYPEICKVYEVGKSIKGKSILCLRLTSQVNQQDQPKRPRFLMSCAIHGDELNGTYLSYKLMDFLIEGQKTGNADAKRFLEGLDLFLIPHMNPDGTFPNGNTMEGCMRPNSAGADLNRSYPSPDGKATEEETMQNTQPETKVVVAFEKAWRFNFALDYHDNANHVLYHWGYKEQQPHTSIWLKSIARRYAQPLGYRVAQASSFYVASGARMDWQPYFNHCWGFTMECENKGTAVQASWDNHSKGLFALFNEAMGGISGTVTGASGEVKVTLKKEGKPWDKDGSEAYTRPDGYYTHYAPAGTWDVEYTCGDKSKTVTGVQVQYGKGVKVDVDLAN